ncbi:MAG: hypothetical protein ACRCX2_25865 [Paraclostridium sp.]
MKIKNLFKALFFSEDSEPVVVFDAKSTELPDKNLHNNAESVYGRSSSLEQEVSFFATCKEKARQKYMCENMDPLLDKIKEEITVQPLLARVIRNISKGVLKNGYRFECSERNVEIESAIKRKFDNLLMESGYEENEFLQETLMNLIKYSNVFVKPLRSGTTNKLIGVLNMQNKGFSVSKAIGTGIAKQYKFERKGVISGYVQTKADKAKLFNAPYDIWHCAFSKETDEVFGMPIWVSVIPIIKKYNYLISSSIDSYSDQSIEQTIFRVGLTKNGNVKPVTPESFNSLKNQLQHNQGEDIITDVPVDPVTVSKTYTSPDKILDVLSTQVIAGLFTSESQLGRSGAGRQDSETQQSNTDGIVLEFQKTLENFLNKTMIKEIAKELYPLEYLKNPVKIKFIPAFNDTERLEKHAVFKFQGGIIDLDEAREICGHTTQINSSKTNYELYQKTEIDGTTQNTNSPANQHTSGTGTTKKSKNQ